MLFCCYCCYCCCCSCWCWCCCCWCQSPCCCCCCCQQRWRSLFSNLFSQFDSILGLWADIAIGMQLVTSIFLSTLQHFGKSLIHPWIISLCVSHMHWYLAVKYPDYSQIIDFSWRLHLLHRCIKQRSFNFIDHKLVLMSLSLNNTKCNFV